MILDTIINYAANMGIIENTPEAKDAFDATIMNVFVPRPSAIIREFYSISEKSSTKALEYLYNKKFIF